MECWLGKQANLTSTVVSDVLEDEGMVRHATLQSHAVTDFLLLARGHSCQEFDRICCFNLSSHRQSIYTHIQQLRQEVHQLKIKKDPEWFENFFQHWGLKGWVASILNSLVWVLIIFIVLMTMFCVFKCFKEIFREVFYLNKGAGVNP